MTPSHYPHPITTITSFTTPIPSPPNHHPYPTNPRLTPILSPHNPHSIPPPSPSHRSHPHPTTLIPPVPSLPPPSPVSVPHHSQLSTPSPPYPPPSRVSSHAVPVPSRAAPRFRPPRAATGSTGRQRRPWEWERRWLKPLIWGLPGGWGWRRVARVF